MEVKYKNGVASVAINEIYPEDAGHYMCKASNTKGCVSTSSNVKVIPSTTTNGLVNSVNKTPPRVYKHIQSMSVNDGEPTCLECTITCESHFQVVWLHNEKEIKPSKDFRYVNQGGNIYRLEIAEIFPEDSGTYTCEAYNDSGDCFSTCTLFVNSSGEKCKIMLKYYFKMKSLYFIG